MDEMGQVPLGVYVMFAVNLIAVIGGITRGVTVLLSVRDEIRDLRKDVGSINPPTGLIGRVNGLTKEVSAHRDTLIELTSELGMKRPGGRS